MCIRDRADVAALADPDDLDGDGISGRMHIVTDPQTGQPRLGRYGYKATEARVLHQVASALNTDMGVMTSVMPNPDCGSQQANCGGGSELDDVSLGHLEAYIALLGMRPQRDLDDPAVVAGETHFTEAGCGDCHWPSFQTSAYATRAEVRDQAIRPYTDLLLHDMGPGLADSLAEGDAAGSEWRTAPLWSIGLTPQVNQGQGYLHDGRARTLEEAIRWHDGEARASREAFEALNADDQQALLRFLGSL